MPNDFAVLALSCDKHSDVWGPFLRQFRRHFPAGPWPVYVGSNTIPCQENGVISLLSGPDSDWSSSYKRILAQIPERKLFVVLADCFLERPVDPGVFECALRFVVERDVNHLKYWPVPKPDLKTDIPGIGEFSPGAPYRATVCGFWDRRCLASLLIEGENPWLFEILGSYRTTYMDGFYGVKSSLYDYRNLIEKGRWIPESVAWAKAEGLDLKLDRRPMLQGADRLLKRLQMIYFDMMLLVPWRLRVGLMNVLRKALISY